MSKFPLALYGILCRYKRNTFELAEACNYPEEMIYNWRYGRGGTPSPGHLIKMARAFANTRKEVEENHLDLLYSHLLDDCFGPGAKFINIEILPTALPIVSCNRLSTPIRRSSELDLIAIRKHIWYDANLQKTVRAIARPLRGKPTPPSLESTLTPKPL